MVAVSTMLACGKAEARSTPLVSSRKTERVAQRSSSVASRIGARAQAVNRSYGLRSEVLGA